MSNEQRATHARVLRLKNEPANSDKTIKEWTSEILPLLKKQDGFRGATLVGNRKTGDGLSVTYWASEEAMTNARPKVRPQAETIMSSLGSKIVRSPSSIGVGVTPNVRAVSSMSIGES